MLAPSSRLVCALLILGLPASVGARPFIRVEGTRFMAGEEPFYFVGANLNVMHGPVARAKAASTIHTAARDGLKVGRIWAMGEGAADAPGWRVRDELFRAGPDGWQEAAYLQLDHVIAQAGARGLRLIITLANRWPDYGGAPMYLRWAGVTRQEGYGSLDGFFSDPRCWGWYLEHMRRLVGRTNSVTGVAYKDDPTIMSWELMNELGGTPEAAPARRQWAAEMIRQVRALDPNHLVVPGTLGYDLSLEREAWISMCSLPGVAYCDQHAYPINDPRSRTPRLMARYIDDRVQLAHHVVGKPIIFGEFGFADRGSMSRRARLHGRFLRRLFGDGGNGALAWIYQPTIPWKRGYGVMVDQRRHRVVRRALAREAKKIQRRTPRSVNRALGKALGKAPLWPTHLTRRGPRRTPHVRWRRDSQGASLSIPVDQFHAAHFETSGAWAKGELLHVYGRRTGWLSYRFRGPGFTPARLVLRLRLSSEYPDKFAPAHGTSRVKVQLDGADVATLEAAPDDGVGTWHQVTVTDPRHLAPLARGRHTLRLEVRDGPGANGLALYGRRTPHARESVGDAGPLTLRAARN